MQPMHLSDQPLCLGITLALNEGYTSMTFALAVALANFFIVSDNQGVVRCQGSLRVLRHLRIIASDSLEFAKQM